FDQHAAGLGHVAGVPVDRGHRALQNAGYKKSRLRGSLWELPFLDLGSLAAALTQIVQLGATDLAAADHHDVIQAGGMQGERALHAYAVGRAADGERLAHRTVAAGDDHALKRLQTLAGTFDDLHEHAHGIADAELGNV